VSVVCRKLSWPHGKFLIGAATGLGAEGCSAIANASRTPVHVHNRIDILVDEKHQTRENVCEIRKNSLWETVSKPKGRNEVCDLAGC
jgi:hypothetical protein